MTNIYENHNSHIPSIKELRAKYREEKRYILEIKEKESMEKSIDKEGSFFNTFRKYEFEEIEKFNYKNEYYSRYKKYIESEFISKSKEIARIKNCIAYEKFFLEWERKLIFDKENSFLKSNPATRYRVDRIKKLEEELDELITKSEIAHTVYNKEKLLDDIENQKNKKLVNVDYVLDAKNKVKSSLKKGVPVNIIGHLGSGKTALATEAAVEFTIENMIQELLEKKMEEWYLNNKNASFEEVLSAFESFNTSIRKRYKEILINGKKEDLEKIQPLFISGSHNLSYEDMFIEKTLSLNSSFSGEDFEYYLNYLSENFFDWIDNHQKELEEIPSKEEFQIKVEIWKSLSDLLVAKNSAFGTEIKKIEKEILIAVKEGRPVIVDELNAIAMQNLIALNDILQKNIGSTAYVTGIGPVKIKRGFAFIGTGNLSTRLVSYEGTNELNPAFKSRFMTIEYNYLPQSLIGSLYDQSDNSKNELFRVIITRLLDGEGNLHIGNPRKTLDELFRFAQLSRVTQNVFMGKWKDAGDEESTLNELELKESVLSIRNILHILDDWNLGEEKDIDLALWDSFISSITYPDDQSYILSQCLRFGFFAESEGWKVKTKSIGEATTTYDEIRTRPYQYTRPKIEILSYLDVLDIIFGKKEFKEDEALMEFLELDSENDSISRDDLQKLDKKIRKLEYSKDIMDYLYKERDGEENER
ncbi:hypothetical protein UF10_02255 [Peptostreptococcus russellii]|uniref:AAA domain (Dynein-related subfamily) n=1 Tax=Peptostreptococcus russellii TaxID=215200 RepID=A0A2P7Q0M4_9FIRM|nr:hypothetical protein [Peptostreptococcus russellii]PSJ31487.1 hypothetical protein UF10_02255 [Peptostreptococcus russellii]